MSVRLVLLATVLLAPLAAAHDGPPYPILVDGSVGGRTLSVWADPDVGEGTFYLYLPDEEDAPQPELSVRIHVRPLDGGPGETTVDAARAPAGRPYQRTALVDFPRRGTWSVRVALESPAGEDGVALDVEVTPPGFGKLDLLWFTAPFLLLGFVWLKVFLRRRSHERGAGDPSRDRSVPHAS